MPQDTTISDQFIGRCTPAMSVDASRIDGITTINVAPTTKSQVEAIYHDKANALWKIVGNLLEADFRGVACQKKINGFAEWLKGTAKVIDPERISKAKISTGLYDVRPFLLMETENPINNIYWNFTGGVAAGGGETSPNTALPFDWKGVVASQQNIPADARWFGQRTTVTISGKNAGDGAHALSVYRVVDVQLVGTALWVYLVNIGANVDDPLYSYNVGHSKRANVAFGVLSRGLPNVTTGEAYCSNIPGLNTRQLKPFWIQHTRRTVREDDQYLKYAKLISDNNPLFKTFGDVDSVRYNKQVEEDYDNLLVNTFMSNPALVNQTEDKYDQLEKVNFFAGDQNSNSYSFEGRMQLRRANALGYFEQLAQCTDSNGIPALIDLLGQNMKLSDMATKFYDIVRVRKANGLDAQVLELWCTSQFREVLVDAYTLFFKNKSQSTLNLYFDLTTKQNSFGFTWVSIKLPFPAVELRLVSHWALDDYVAAHRAASIANGDNAATADAYKFIGNIAFCPDFSVTYRGLIDSGTVVFETAAPKDLARVDASLLCGPLMAPQQRVKHYWEIFTQVTECATSQAAWENFSMTVDQ